MYDGEPCYYCGQPATDREHVIPRSVLSKLDGLIKEEKASIIKGRILTVPACGNCNHLLGSSIQETLAGRKTFLKERLRVHYKKILDLPDWSEEELSMLGPHLRGIVMQGLVERNRLRARITW